MTSWPRSWERLVEEVFGPGTRIVFPRFFESKKNQVTLLTLVREAEPFQVLAKRYVWGEASREHEVLVRAHGAGLAVPRPLALHGEVGFQEVVPGTRLRGPVSLGRARALGRWLAAFHRELGLVRGDCVLPNFLVTPDGALVGLDFEESGPGDPLEDVAGLGVSLLLASPVPDPSVLSALLEGYGRVPRRDLEPRMQADLAGRHRFLPEREADLAACARSLASWREAR